MKKYPIDMLIIIVAAIACYILVIIGLETNIYLCPIGLGILAFGVFIAALFDVITQPSSY